MEMKRAFVFIMVFILFFVSGCATTRVNVDAGRVKITSMPSGAKVKVNEERFGVTPCVVPLSEIRKTTFYMAINNFGDVLGWTIVGIPFYIVFGWSFGYDPDKAFSSRGEIVGIPYAITASWPGFAPVIKKINSKDAPKSLHFALTGSEYKNIRIVTTPPEAKVYTEDGKFLGSTPLSAEILFKYKEGELQKTIIEIKKSGYKSIEREISMNETEVDVHLSKE